jgi:hypothetical protein
MRNAWMSLFGSGIALGAIALGACDGGGPAPLTPDGGDVTPTVTYYEHVRPILVENCVMCHHDGGIAPFALTTYSEVVEHADDVAQATHDRIMPPFLADNSGSCNTWTNYRGLTDEEIATIGSWVDQRVPMGDPSIPAPQEHALPTLPTTDLTLQMEAEYTMDSTLTDDYRCFVVPVDTDVNLFVRGYDVMPGNSQRVHHVIVYNPADEAQVTAARERDAQDERMGYQCFGGPIVDASPVVLWAPGAGAVMFPQERTGLQTGIMIEAGRDQIIQIHYNNHEDIPAEVPFEDRTTIALSTVADDCNVRPAYFFPILDYDLNIPPRVASHIESQDWSLQDLGVPAFAIIPVWGVLPHMHTMGRSINVTRIPEGGTEECVVDLPRWDFHWQMPYFLGRPINVLGTDTMRITCEYNSMERDAMVHWGEGTQDEMCLAYMLAAPPLNAPGCTE